MPQLSPALLTKKKSGNVIITVFTVLQLAVDAGSADAVVNAKTADCAVFPAMRFAKGIVIETAVTWPCLPTVPVAEQVVV